MTMNTPSADIEVNFDIEVEDIDADLLRLEMLVRTICTEFETPSAQISVCIIDDAGIIKTHRKFLNQDHTTDVISFDLSDEFESHKTFQLVVNAQMAQRQAKERGHSTEAELALYITHGMLHNLGFDDLNEEDAQKMHKTEDTILQANGFGIIYDSNKKSD